MTSDCQPSALDHGINVIKSVVKTLPEKPGVYRMYNRDDEPLYVGKAKSLKKRVVAYTKTDQLPVRLQRMVAETIRMEIVTTHSEIEALLLESNLIKKLQPRYNILLKDDKSFPYVLITQDHKYPRIVKHRGPQQIKGRYFGPFASNAAVDESLILLQKIFLLRNCTDNYFSGRTRPCLQYHIKRCSAPCVNKINPEDYNELVKQAIDFILGRSSKVQEFLATKMHAASEALDYEAAATYRDRIAMITRLVARQRINVEGISDADVVAILENSGQTCVQVFFFRHGRNFGTESFFLAHAQEASLEEKLAAFLTQFYAEREPPKKVLLSYQPEELDLIKSSCREHFGKVTSWEIPKMGTKKELIDHALSNAKDAISRKLNESSSMAKLFEDVASTFQLSARPSRIEVYDNSHVQGTNPYGVMVVADENGFNRRAYRKFAIKGAQPGFGGDDYAMMREVLSRRFARADQEDWQLPDLMLIDGGLGQLNAVLKVMEEMDIKGVTIVGIAKGEQRNAGRERFFMVGQEPFSLEHNSPTLHFLQRLRDEAHRFAIGTHRAGRQKSMIKSQLDEISGIGPKRKKALLQHFGSVRGISAASVHDLMVVEGISEAVANVIYSHFHDTLG
ncbi:excinuclease ABC subunit UvrC [Candidatus Odyssella thessalonicensis]|uniref:excinuclease ABC subunit UvrC n=1 Tax=Candidatus Odyssella thessalonicensis TaxID=84647 RepID=UPI00049515F3|nr:excinuclease ABC subunit UvrC [Candidatus Odyssella thessalonicensis]